MPITLCFASWNVANDGRLKANCYNDFFFMMMGKDFGGIRQLNLLDRLQLIMAWITDAYIELKAHNRYTDAIHRAFITNGTSAMSTMMLSNTCFLFAEMHFQ